jgi:hypothetical protein
VGSGIIHSMKRLVWGLVIFAMLGLGCAQFPSGGGTAQGRRLVITLKVAGRINAQYGTYFFMINTEPFNTGVPINEPIPIVAPPWGNGIAEGRYNYFVVWSSDFPNDYRLYRVDPDNLQNYQFIGRPVASTLPNIDDTAVGESTRTIRFEILLSQILPTAALPDQVIDTIRFNYITTDKWGVLSPQDSKRWDALGNSNIGDINKAIILDIRQDKIVNNTNRNPDPSSPEPEGDVTLSGPNGQMENITVPDLDIVDWQVEVRS